MISLTIPSPCEAVTSNQRLHFAVKAKRTRAWREAANWAAQMPSVEHIHYPHAHVRVVFHFTDNRRRDVGNWYPTAKACLDGVVDAGLLPDDSDTYVVGPDLRAGDKADALTVLILLDPDCGCRDCAHRFGPRLQLIKGETK